MRLFTLLLLFLVRFVSYGQTDTSGLSKSFIEKTIQYYYNSQANEESSKPVFLILKDTVTSNIQTDYSNFNVTFVSRDEAVEKISKTKKKAGQLDKIKTQWLSLDTFDVSIAGWGVSVKKVNQVINGQKIKYHSYFMASCGGTLGYIPTCRFVFDKASNSWTQITDTEIVKQRLAKRNTADN